MYFDFTTKQGTTLLRYGIAPDLSDEEIILQEIKAWRLSQKRKLMLTGMAYDRGDHDILKRHRTAIGQDGKLKELSNLPNNRTINNQYHKLVLQKTNYLVGQPLTFTTQNEALYDHLMAIFDRRFHRTLNRLAEDSLNCGLGWLYVGVDDRGELVLRRIKPSEIIAGWRDDEKTELDYVIRVYTQERRTRQSVEAVEKIEVYDEGVVRYFELVDGRLKPAAPYETPYLKIEDTSLAWPEIPFIPWRSNAQEIPLIKRVKSLQDGLNQLISDFQNALQEDARNTILIIHNYDGQDLGEFRQNLATYGAVKVSEDGDVSTLEVKVDAGNYEAILKILKQAIIENGAGFDSKDDRMLGNPNQMNIQSMYSEIDLDANAMETEFQASFDQLLGFIASYLSFTGQAVFDPSTVDVIFNRDVLINESEAIQNIVSSQGILSRKTLIAQHPWIDDPQGEIERLRQEQTENRDFYDPFASLLGSRSLEE